MSSFASLFAYGRKTVKAVEPWEAKAAAKRASTLAKIPPEWLLEKDELDKAAKQRDLTGRFIEQYLNEEEIKIIHEGSATLVDIIRLGNLSAVQVTRAFCKTAAIAHQVVSDERRL
jgi:amidase